jgi:catechol 2,3-dioxygenase
MVGINLAPARDVSDTAGVAIDPDTTVGAVRLAVADLDRVREFYERVVGLRTLEQGGNLARLGADGTPVVELVGVSDAPPRPGGTTGLFHLAILLPSRVELARSVRRLGEAGWPLAGASDHLVSEALYLADPEGNGIEIYRDRPRAEWPREEGRLQMGTFPLDLDSLAAELIPERGATPMATDPRIGHVHLHVADLEATEGFYAGTLGFDVTVRDYPGALFLSAGGYHHHIGANTWAGEGAPPPPPGSRGLRWFELVLPSATELDRLEGRLREAGFDPERREDGLHVADPSGNGVVLRAATG